MTVSLISCTPNPERHIEFCARSSYNSLDKMDEDSYLRILPSLFKNHNLSVFEHAYASFLIEEISRATSHQLVRHRLASFSQRSQRVVSEADFSFVIPPSIQSDAKLAERFDQTMRSLSETYALLLQKGISKEDARFVLPNATTTTLTITANFREWLHIIDLRTSPNAQWEIRQLIVQIWKQLYKEAPLIFGLTYFEQFSQDFENKRKIYYEEIQT